MNGSRKLLVAAVLCGLTLWILTAGAPAGAGGGAVKRASPSSVDKTERASTLEELVGVREALPVALQDTPEPTGDEELEAVALAETPAGTGEIRGHVRLTSGDPCPVLSVVCQAVDMSATPGLLSGRAETARDGSFGVTGLAPGSFSFLVAWDDELVEFGSFTAEVGDRAVELTVDAALYSVSCVDDEGGTVAMSRLEVSRMRREDSGLPALNFRRKSYRGVDSFELLLTPIWPYMFQARGVDGARYFAYLEEAPPAGTHQVALTLNPTNLGRLVLSTRPGVLNAGAQIEVPFAKYNGTYVDTVRLLGEEASETGALEVKGLRPGRYGIMAMLTGSEWVNLVEPHLEFELEAGEVKQVELDTWEGGRIELSVELFESDAFAFETGQVWVRLFGDEDWSRPSFESKRGPRGLMGATAWLDGTPALSRVIEPGMYRVKVEADGGETAEADVVVGARLAAPLKISLRGD